MAKKHKHEEHVNHERWVISFADMMTLLFALFVVLYAGLQADLSKLKKIKESIQFAFHISGEGKTKDTGIFEKQAGAGEVPMPAPLVTAQDGEMREFLKDVLPEYQEVAGKSLVINQTDDTVSLTAPLSDFFPEREPFPMKRDVQGWLDKAIDGSLTFTSDIKVLIEAPDVIIGRKPNGGARTSIDLCGERLRAIERVVCKNPQVRDGMVEIAFRRQKQVPGQKSGNWEDQATVTIAFSNSRAGNR
jgi:hypothetical protein